MNLLTISRFIASISSEHSYTHRMDDPTASEAGALAELGLNELSTAVDGIHKIQRAISERVFRLVGFGVGPAAKPVKIDPRVRFAGSHIRAPIGCASP